jgi:exodeoxyribonuclease VII small subunit
MNSPIGATPYFPWIARQARPYRYAPTQAGADRLRTTVSRAAICGGWRCSATRTMVPRTLNMRPGMTDTPVEEMSFEAAMAELEKVLGQLERGDVALDESIALYERGAKLKARCETKLKEAEEKVAAITLDAEGNPVGLKPVDGV